MKKRYLILRIAAAVLISVGMASAAGCGKADNEPLTSADFTHEAVTADVPETELSRFVFENADGEGVFDISVGGFIDCFNEIYSRRNGEAFLSDITSDEWHYSFEPSLKFGYGNMRYIFTEDGKAWLVPTLSVYTSDCGDIYEVRVTFDHHSYRADLYDKYREMCFCLIRSVSPSMTDEQIDTVFGRLRKMADENIFGDHSRFGDEQRPPLGSMIKIGNVGLYGFFGSGNVEMCIIPLTHSAEELLEAEGTSVFINL